MPCKGDRACAMSPRENGYCLGHQWMLRESTPVPGVTMGDILPLRSGPGRKKMLTVAAKFQPLITHGPSHAHAGVTSWQFNFPDGSTVRWGNTDLVAELAAVEAYVKRLAKDFSYPCKARDVQVVPPPLVEPPREPEPVTQPEEILRISDGALQPHSGDSQADDGGVSADEGGNASTSVREYFAQFTQQVPAAEPFGQEPASIPAAAPPEPVTPAAPDPKPPAWKVIKAYLEKQGASVHIKDLSFALGIPFGTINSSVNRYPGIFTAPYQMVSLVGPAKTPAPLVAEKDEPPPSAIQPAAETRPGPAAPAEPPRDSLFTPRSKIPPPANYWSPLPPNGAYMEELGDLLVQLALDIPLEDVGASIVQENFIERLFVLSGEAWEYREAKRLTDDAMGAGWLAEHPEPGGGDLSLSTDQASHWAWETAFQTILALVKRLPRNRPQVNREDLQPDELSVRKNT